ncbi:MAG TPA: hypothetical protein VF507_01630, partial [Pyrinomonadaceae bacterium]
GDSNNDVQCYAVAFPGRKLGLLVFTNSGNGHSIIPQIIGEALGGNHPAIAWINYEPYNSPARTLLRDLLARGDAALRDYRERKKTTAGAIGEDQMNRVGYALLTKNKVDLAIEVFKLNVEDYPNSWNVYDSLAEAYAVKGEKELAVKNYQKSIELNPQNEGGKEALKKLQGQ